MKNILSGFAVALAVLGLLTVPCSQLRAKGASHRDGYYPRHVRHHKKKQLPPYEAIGAVNASAGTVTIVPKNGASHQPRTLRLTPETVVTINGQRSTASQLQPGMKVNVGQGADADVAAELTAVPAPRN